MSKALNEAASGDMCRQRPDAPLAHRRPEYPLPGCVPAEPDSVSSGRLNVAEWLTVPQTPLDIGVMP